MTFGPICDGLGPVRGDRSRAGFGPFACLLAGVICCAILLFASFSARSLAAETGGDATAATETLQATPADAEPPGNENETRTRSRKLPPPGPAQQWIFDPSRYTNSPTTGRRVLQYQHPTPAFRDPNAFYDSPHEAYPFSPAPYGPYPRFAPPRYYGTTAYDPFAYPYWPYFGYGINFYGP